LLLARALGLKTNPIEDVDYRIGFFQTVQDTNAVIELLTGPFKGTVYSYDWVRVTEDPELGVAKLSFNYTILHNTKFMNDLKFHQHAGDILREILLSPGSKIGKKEYNGKLTETDS